ncbi:hypothetical protein BH20VER2_BH20VER2_01510 [soil metagenome]|nr:hypothetical protein [Chthoniobacterales bacterium]
MQRRAIQRIHLTLACLVLLTSCASTGGPAAGEEDGHAVAALQQAVTGLSPRVDRREARRLSETAHAVSRQLARDYGVVGPALFHNVLVNAKIKERGLCHQWAEDLFRRLYALRLQTLELHWGEARAGTLREHNSVVVTAKGQPFAQGIVLDPWRRSGRLVWARTAADRYPWREGESESLRRR